MAPHLFYGHHAVRPSSPSSLPSHLAASAPSDLLQYPSLFACDSWAQCLYVVYADHWIRKVDLRNGSCLEWLMMNDDRKVRLTDRHDRQTCLEERRTISGFLLNVSIISFWCHLVFLSLSLHLSLVVLFPLVILPFRHRSSSRSSSWPAAVCESSAVSILWLLRPGGSQQKVAISLPLYLSLAPFSCSLLFSSFSPLFLPFRHWCSYQSSSRPPAQCDPTKASLLLRLRAGWSDYDFVVSHPSFLFSPSSVSFSVFLPLGVVTAVDLHPDPLLSVNRRKFLSSYDKRLGGFNKIRSLTVSSFRNVFDCCTRTLRYKH